MILTPVKNDFYIAWLHAGHYKNAAALECYSCENFLQENDIRRLMRKKNVGGFLISELTKPIGYVIYEKRRRHIPTTLEILNFVVHEDYRRRGVGTLLLERLMTRKLWSDMTVAVRESNLGAQLFLREKGFQATKIERQYFQDFYAESQEVEDAYIFRKMNSFDE